MPLNSQHATGFTLSVLFHGAIIASLLLGQTGSQSLEKPGEILPLSLAMFQAEAMPKTAAATQKPIQAPEESTVKPIAKTIVPNNTVTPHENKKIDPTREVLTLPVDEIILAEKAVTAKVIPEETIAEEIIDDLPNEAQTEADDKHEKIEAEVSSVSAKPSTLSRSISTNNNSVTDHGIIETLEAEYMAALRKAIEAQKHYPKRARRLKREGDVIIDFIIYRNGKINHIQVQQSSGTQILDNAAVNAIKRLGQFKPIPPEIPRDSWALEIPITYALM